MANDIFPESGLPIRRTIDLLPQVFKTEANQKFMEAVVDPLVQPGVLQKTVGYIGRRYGKTYNSSDVYLDDDTTLRSRYQLEPGVVVVKNEKVEEFYDYIDLKNQIKFFGNDQEKDYKITDQDHFSWNPPVDWDKFVNYREYYWVPSGPPAVKILGQAQNVTSTYRVSLGLTNTYIFSPDGFTNNPTITLYRGQTYKFQVNVPGNGLMIRTAIDTGSLLYNPIYSYTKGQLTVFDGKIWRALNNIPSNDGSTIDENTQDWELVDDSSETTALDYIKGITNNGVESGTITFEVPYDAPDVLFYQSFTDPNKFGRFLIADIESNTKIDVEKEIIGKSTYTSSNGVTLSNGMIVYFLGEVAPAKYADKNATDSKWIVEGVGEKISLTKFSDLVVSSNLTQGSLEILFDNSPFDTQPFDDASAYPFYKDYITINRGSRDSNPWSRYNRWFHRSVLDYSHEFNGTSFEATETTRAKRPIIEFLPNLKLFNHGSVAKNYVDFIDRETTDVFSLIEGSRGYIVDGESLFEGARLLVVSDTDSLANNRIYEVTFITHNNVRQISLRAADDTNSSLGDGVFVRRGNKNKGLMFHFDGTSWIQSQIKTAVNQTPLFDLFDETGISFSDESIYPVSTFKGTPILSYKVGNAVVDSELGFSLSYLNIDNVGDIQFEYDLDKGSFDYSIDRVRYSKNYNSGYFKISITDEYQNGWVALDKNFVQPVIDSIKIDVDTNSFEITPIYWDRVTDSNLYKVLFYVNGVLIKDSYTREKSTFTFNRTFSEGDIVSIKVFSDVEPDTGYYEIPLGLEKNPLNDLTETFTLGQASDHLFSGLELIDTFEGRYPGSSNLRDISGYRNLTKRFLKHSGLVPLSLTLLVDKQKNIIKSIQFAKKSYTEFKNVFVKLADELYFDQNPGDFVDTILEEYSKTKDSSRAFSGSDMIGSGAYSSIDYEVEDDGIKTFALSEKFDLDTLSNRAVYVYLNDTQLLFDRDYEFNSTFGFIILKVDLTEGDMIQIREYVSTGFNFIPPTPTKLGLYKKYTPRKFIDDTYVTPTEVIQGHDGSITVAYGDFRDDVLLELEYRIYNNIKQKYDESIFDNDRVLGGYYETGTYSKSEIDKILNADFLRWIADTNIDYITNSYFDSENSFTYTYSNMTDPTGQKNLPGYWKGAYLDFYDTVRPHIAPWEMLGFSEKPTWWEEQYGSAPYTKNNLLLWEDLRDGIIRQGDRMGSHSRYQRPSLLNHIPVDGDGNLLSPLDSGLAGNFTLINNKGPFVFGDVGPAEYAWRSSSEWAFSIISALCLLKPFEFISDNFNRSNLKVNLLGQTVSKLTDTFISLSDLKFDYTDEQPVSGLFVYLKDYAKNYSIPSDELKYDINSLDVKLTSRISGFVDQQQQKYILDSKSPKSSSGNIFVPPENYDVIYNVSAPIYTLDYSGLIIEKTSQGWKIGGYDFSTPYFDYYDPISSTTDPVISVGGVSENFLEWQEEKFYGNGVIVRYKNTFYRSLSSHTSSLTFDISLWKQLPSLPLVNSVNAQKRRTFNRLYTKRIPYGQLFTSVQQIVDFILGYQEYLNDQGFVFENYDSESQVVQDWFTSAKEFMFWSKHNWSTGSLLTLSPSASYLEIKTSIGVADNILDSFYDYSVLKNDGTPLNPNFINVSRGFQSFKMTTTNTTEGIYHLRLNFVLKEHVVVFDDRTVFNDVIYDKTTGYRQERIKSRGFRTVDWDGDYTSPGFLFDNVDISNWQPFTDYKLGDIVSYKSYYWTSKENQLGSSTFDDTKWTKLDSNPTKQLIPNFDYRINQFGDYYETDTDGVGSSQRDLARHIIGYQQREYLQNLAEDEISQFRLYQGFIREKGTPNSIVKVFDKLSKTTDDSVVLNEEWAFKVGQLGGTDQIQISEINFEKGDFVLNPQPILFVNSDVVGAAKTDQYLRLGPADFTESAIPFTTNINSKSPDKKFSRNAGYVKVDSVEHILKTRDDLLNLDINTVKENDHIWITFDDWTWTVLRYNEALSLRIIDTKRQGNNEQLILNRPATNISVGDYIGITYVANLTGFFKVVEKGISTITVESTSKDDALIEDSTAAVIGILTEVRIDDYQSVDPQQVAILEQGSKLWVDDNGSGNWEVVEKNQIYFPLTLVDYGITDPRNLGTAVVYIRELSQVITSIPTSTFVMVYSEKVAPGYNNLTLQQSLPAPDGFETAVNGVFGEALAVSPDTRWLAIGSPNASGVKSKYMGELTPDEDLLAGEIVLFNGKLWEAQNNIRKIDGSTINFDSQDWTPATLVTANSTGRSVGHTKQGMISLYKFQNQQWEHYIDIISPRPHALEQFGSSISFGVSGSKYYMAVAAAGSADNRGRVYLYQYNGTDWVHLEDTRYSGVYNTGAEIEGTIASNILTIDSFVQGNVQPGMIISGDGIPEGTTITRRIEDPTYIKYELNYDPPTTSLILSSRRITGIVKYPKGAVVWSDGSLWESLSDVYSDGSSITIDSVDWQKLDPISTSNSLPKNIALEDDGSTLALGLLEIDDYAELVKENDGFGRSLAMNRDGSVLVVGAPSSDGQYFANYRGVWKDYQEYTAGDVVLWQNGYHRLDTIDPEADSLNTSKGDYPDNGHPWINVGDSTITSTGKIYIYRRNSQNIYKLTQTITSDVLAELNDTGITESIGTGDQFGFSIDLDSNGTTLIVSSPQADVFKQNQGSVYVFKYNNIEFRLTQKLTSFEDLTNEYFGSSIAISPGTERIAVGARNSAYSQITGFEAGTTFDKGRTQFSDPKGFPGQVYVYERKDQGYFLVDKLSSDDVISGEAFGYAVDCNKSTVVVGSPRYEVDGIQKGNLRVFKKDDNTNSLTVIQQQEDLIDLELLKNVELYDAVNYKKIADIDVVDPYKLKILGIAEQEINFKTIYDPAIYMKGISDLHNIDETQCWFEKNIGKVWWDLAAVKFLHYEQSDLAYRIGHWGEQAVGSTVDIYEWVETPLLPSEWSALADTVEGLAEGISGQPKYPDNTVYNTKVFYNSSTGQQVGTKYYYWVKNKSTLPDQPTERRIPCSTLIDLIENPIGSGNPFLAIVDSDKVLAYNFMSSMTSDIISLNIEWYKDSSDINLIHKEYQLLTEGVADSLPTEYLERKWIDSLVGYDQTGNQVPDPNLSEKQKYGISFRPRQTIFEDRSKALKITIDNINSILELRPFTDLVNFDNLSSKDPLPSFELNEYDVDVDTYIDLQQVGTVRIRQASFSINIINGQIDTVDIIDSGFGYRTVPFIEIEGDGIGARAQVTLDNQGRVNSITLLSRGRKYTSAIVKIRPFSVLVRNDSTASGFWSIYGYDQQRKIFYRRKSQGFDTTVYWEFIDWYASGYNSKSRITKEIQAAYQLPSLIIESGAIIRIKEYAEGGWALVEKTLPGLGTLYSDYNLIARQGGTIRIKETLYDQLINSLGYDAVGSYDASVYDLQPIQELRNILKAVKEDIFVDDLRVEWNKLFFAGIKYAFSERIYVDWAFKTSFLNAIHNVGPLEKKANYKNDNLEAYEKYIEEVKPYRTSIREYTSRYTDLDNTYSATTDFDLPPSYSIRDGQILPINQAYNRFDEYPWKWWTDNNGYSIVEIRLSNPGSGYKNPPTVLIEGNGTGAKAEAFISSGRVSGFRMISQGTGYTSVPKISLVGGNGTNQDIAKAVAIMGETSVRTFDMSMKFDRISKTGFFNSYEYTQTFVATGFSAVFNLTYAPTRDKNKISIIKNDQIVLKNEYTVDLYYQQVDGYTVLRGKITFVTAPAAGDSIVIEYEKNDELFDSINRVDRYYAPVAGMKGKEMNQLMTGIDYGGVQVQGTTFDVTGGWDALPWFTDNWDSVEGNSDYYYVADGSTTFVVLPYVPTDGQLISIYIKRNNESRATRIDDPFWNSYDGSTPQPNGRINPPEQALMPTFVGDGSSNFIELHDYLRTYPGDTLIFRTIDSDGSVTITDVNLLDTRVSGGSLEQLSGAYTTATGMTPEEIVIDGEEFISPDQVPATEENVPGQVLESISLKVYSTTDPGAAPILNRVLLGDSETTVYDIGLSTMTANSILVYIDRIKQELGTDYDIDFVSNTIQFQLPPSLGQIIEIIAVGIGGVSLIDYQEFEADGETSLFLTKADYDGSTGVLVTVNGEIVDTGFVNSSEFVDTPGRTLIQFGITPARRSIIKVVVFGTSNISTSDAVSFIRINQQVTAFDGSTRSIALDTFVDTGRGSAQSSILVNVNGVYLTNVDTIYQIYDGTNNEITIGIDPAEAVGSITSDDIKVFVNNQLQRFVIDYTFNGNENLITIPTDRLEIDDIIKIETDTRSLYSISDNILTIESSVALTEGDLIEITWFSEYPTMDLISDEFAGGQVQYRLDRSPLDINYLWVYKNGQRLIRDVDYSLSLPRAVVYLTEPTTSQDKIKIVQFSSIVYKRPRAFEIFKDMLNNYHYKRFSRNNQVKLARDLNYYDTVIEVTDSSVLSDPIPSRYVPGVIVINNERIEYFAKQGNTLTQIRRGSLGTSIAELHPVDSYVIDVGATETIPYNETQEKIDFVSDGSSLLIGPLEFVPTQGRRNNWYKDTIPTEYGPCDTLEVFVGGQRLRKDPIKQWDENVASISPEGDVTIEAEFSVDGATPYIRLTSIVPAGTRISIIRKQGRLWYERGLGNASKGISLFANNTAIAEFIGKKTTEIPE